MSVLQLQVVERVLQASDLKQIFSGTQNVDSIQVNFDAEWNGYTKTAAFSKNGKDCFFVDLNSSGTAGIPAAVLEEEGTILIGLIGEKGNQRITSSLLKYRVGQGTSVIDLLDPSAVHSLMELLNEALKDTGGITGARAGTTFTPSVSADGLISWTNDGALDNPDPVNIKGPQGVGIQSVTAYFARSTSGTSAPSSGYSTAVPTLTTTYRYMWGYLRLTLTNGSLTETSKTVMGVYGNTGSKGDPGFSPTLSSSKTDKTTTISVTDADGTRELASILDGESLGISSITQYYLQSSSITGVTTSSSGWQKSLPTLTTYYPHLWSYFSINLVDGSTVNSSPLWIGDYNNHLQSAVFYYLRTASSTAPLSSASGWSTAMPEATADYPYVWCHLRLFYYRYGYSMTHAVNTNVFCLKTYQSSAAASGVVLDYTDASNTQDTAMGDAALRAIQSGIMPILYTKSGYLQVLAAEPINNCGTHYIRLMYLITSCSNYIYTTVDWRTSE